MPSKCENIDEVGDDITLLSKGVEPDSSFYIRNEPIMRNKQSLGLTQYPPLDLVIEIDYGSYSIDKLPIYLENSTKNMIQFHSYQNEFSCSPTLKLFT